MPTLTSFFAKFNHLNAERPMLLRNDYPPTESSAGTFEIIHYFDVIDYDVTLSLHVASGSLSESHWYYFYVCARKFFRKLGDGASSMDGRTTIGFLPPLVFLAKCERERKLRPAGTDAYSLL